MSVAITGLPPSTTLSGSEIVPIVQDSYTVRTTTQDIADLATAGGGAFGGLKWACAQIQGNIGAIISATNVDGLTYLSTGNYELDITSAGFSNTNFICTGASFDYTADNGGLIVSFEIFSPTVVRILTTVPDPTVLPLGITPYDSFVNVAFIGT